MHTEVMRYLEDIREYRHFEGPVLEIGSININGSAREVFGDLTPYVGIDIVPGPGVDHVVDIRDAIDPDTHNYLTHKFRTIVCTEVLEHVPPETLIPAFWQFMHGECKVVITCATVMRKPHSADGSPDVKPGEYYKNVNMHQLQVLLTDTPSHIRCMTTNITWNPEKTDLYAYAEYKVI